MTNPLKWWFNRKPYHPAFMRNVAPLDIAPSLTEASRKSAIRSDISVLQSRNLTASVVSLHSELLKMIEGNRP